MECSLQIAISDLKNFAHIFCGRITTREYRITSGLVYVSLKTSPNAEKDYTGFSLEYSREGNDEVEMKSDDE